MVLATMVGLLVVARSWLRLSPAAWQCPARLGALALALSLPASLPYAYDIPIATFHAVIFSVLFQGLTMPLLQRKLGSGR
jgi:NhaP-type Na+/H+ or K+/H+ antiporter